MSGWKSSYSHMVSLQGAVLLKTTRDLTLSVLTSPELAKKPRLRHRILSGIVETIRDPDPERSLKVSANSPIVLVHPPYQFDPIHPMKIWAETQKKKHFWPEPVQRFARHLGGRPELSWRRISSAIAKLGYEALPVQGYVALPMYFHLVEQRIFPVSTLWVYRHKVLPALWAPADVLHDMGHALALSMPDFRRLLEAFAHAAYQVRNPKSWDEIDRLYVQCFEHACILKDDGTAEPLGPLGMTFEMLKTQGTRLYPNPELQKAKLPADRRRFYFKDRADWIKKTEQVIVDLRRLK